MKETFSVQGMHCDSCSKVIERVSARNGAAAIVDVEHNEVTLDGSSEQIASVRSSLKEQGYVLTLPGEPAVQEEAQWKRGARFLSKLVRGELAVERTLLRNALLSFVAMLVVQSIAFVLFYSRIPNFLSAYGPIIFLSAAGVAALSFTFFHTRVFRASTPCMTGMMIGMTMGMASGFLVGAFAGATNGMFVGSVIGSVAGMALGYFVGKCCGVMGIMEGLMGGLMAGTMGAMLSVMMVFDNLMLFLFLLTFAELGILFLYSYMLYKEFGEIPAQRESSLVPMLILSVVTHAVLVFIMAYGPKAGTVIG